MILIVTDVDDNEDKKVCFLFVLSPGQTVLPTRAKLQNQNLHRRVAKRYYHIESACKKAIQLSDYDRAVT